MPYLTLTSTTGAILKQWELRGRTVTVGRGEKADLQIDDGELSRLHFTITPAGEGYVLDDGQSSNGTLVNGKVVKDQVPLKSGDKIRAGTSQFLFEDALETAIRKLEKDGPSYSTFIRELNQPKPASPKPR